MPTPKTEYATWLAELKTFLTTGAGSSVTLTLPDGTTNTDGTLKYPDGKRTETASTWVTIGDANAVNQILHAPQTLGLTVKSGSIPTAKVKVAIALGNEFPAEMPQTTKENLAWLLSEDLFNTENADLVLAVQSSLEEPCPDCWDKFQALLTRPANSIAEYFGGVTQQDIDAIIAPE